MATFQYSDGLHVDHSADPSKAPEVIAQYNSSSDHFVTRAEQQSQQQQHQRIPFGLGAWTFAVLVAVVTAVVVGGGVGGGLGAALSSCQSSTCPVPPAETSACSAPAETLNDTASSWNETTIDDDGTVIYTPKPADLVGNLTLDCPPEGRSKDVGAPDGYTFDMRCGLDAEGGSEAEGGGVVSDIAGIVAYTIDDCLLACVGMSNLNQTQESVRRCRSIVFSALLQEYVKTFGGNCWLKDGKKKRGNWEKNLKPHLAYAEMKED